MVCRYWAKLGSSLIKDVVLLGASFWTAAETLAAV